MEISGPITPSRPYPSGTITPASLDIFSVTHSRSYNGTLAIATPTVGTLYSTDSVTGLVRHIRSKDVLGAR